MRPEPAASVAREAQEPARLGSQTLFRGLDVIELVAEGPITLGDLADRLGLTRSTTHRLASALADRRYLTFVPAVVTALALSFSSWASACATSSTCRASPLRNSSGSPS
jgi:DNA-binding IclR family transcriptional regulator